MRSACGGLVAPRPHAASLRKRALYSTSASLPAGRLREREQSSCNAHDFARMGPNGTRGFEPTPHPCTRPAGGGGGPPPPPANRSVILPKAPKPTCYRGVWLVSAGNMRSILERQAVASLFLTWRMPNRGTASQSQVGDRRFAAHLD